MSALSGGGEAASHTDHVPAWLIVSIRMFYTLSVDNVNVSSTVCPSFEAEDET